MKPEKTNFPAGLCTLLIASSLALSACQSIPEPGASGSAATNFAADMPVPVLQQDLRGQPIVAFFGAPDSMQEGEFSNQAVPGGFYRVYLGRNEQGQHLIQDLYQDTGTPQTSVFPVALEQEVVEWGAVPLHGEVVFYRPNGDVRGSTNYLKGQLHGRDTYYNDDGTERSVYEWEGDMLQGSFFSREPGTLRSVQGEAVADEIISLSGTDANGQPLSEQEALDLLDESLITWYQDIFQ